MRSGSSSTALRRVVILAQVTVALLALSSPATMAVAAASRPVSEIQAIPSSSERIVGDAMHGGTGSTFEQTFRPKDNEVFCGFKFWPDDFDDWVNHQVDTESQLHVKEIGGNYIPPGQSHILSAKGATMQLVRRRHISVAWRFRFVKASEFKDEADRIKRCNMAPWHLDAGDYWQDKGMIIAGKHYSHDHRSAVPLCPGSPGCSSNSKPGGGPPSTAAQSGWTFNAYPANRPRSRRND